MLTLQKWQELDRTTQGGKQKFPASYEDKFRYKLVKDLRDIEIGSHLRAKGSSHSAYEYHHHSICISKNDKGIRVMEYLGSSSGSSSSSTANVTSDSGNAAGKIVLNEMLIKDIKELQVEEVLWPEELKRYSGAKVAERAQKREKEKEYNLANNNCECFANWCICGLNVSLQVTTLCEVLHGGYITFKNAALNGLKSNAIPILANVLDELVTTIELHLERRCFPDWRFISEPVRRMAFAITIVMEISYAIKKILRAIDQYQRKSRINTLPQLFAKIVEIIAKSAGRAGLGIVGSLWGPILFGLLAPYCTWFGVSAVTASLVCGAMGAGLGHLIGVLIGYAAEHIAWAIGNPKYVDG